MSFLNNAPMIRMLPGDPLYNEDRPWQLVEDLRYFSRILGEIIVVEKDYCTDFASVPRVMWRVFPKDGPWSHAAIVHDFLCDRKFRDIDSRKAAKIFHEAMGYLPVPQWKRHAMYWAVCLCGPRW